MRGRWWLLLLIPPVVAFADGSRGTVFGVCWLVGWAVAYGVSLRTRPEVMCRPCNGSGASKGTVWDRSYRFCRCCKGHGGHTRWGVRLFLPGRARELGKSSRRGAEGIR